MATADGFPAMPGFICCKNLSLVEKTRVVFSAPYLGCFLFFYTSHYELHQPYPGVEHFFPRKWIADVEPFPLNVR